MSSTSRPVRNRNQPTRNRDNVTRFNKLGRTKYGADRKIRGK